MKPRKIILPHEREWNFDPVPDEEIALCAIYEYGRNAAAFRQVVENWRAAHPLVVRAADAVLKRRISHLAMVIPDGEGSACPNSESTLTPAQLRTAKWNNLVWLRWLTLIGRDAACYSPSGLSGDDPRRFLFYFPPFPDKPWQAVDALYRRGVCLLCPELLSSGNLHSRLLLAKTDFAEQNTAQNKMLKEHGILPPRPSDLSEQVRGQMEKHILAPALIEKDEGHKKGLVGVLPPGYTLQRNGMQIWSAEICREEVTFVINWAKPDTEIKSALGEWLKAHRACDDFEKGKVTTAREHLRKLGAMRILDSGITGEQAADENIKTEKRFCNLYSSADQYFRAKSEAESVLRNLFPASDS